MYKFRAVVEKPGTNKRWFYYLKIGESVPADLSVVAWQAFTGRQDIKGKDVYEGDKVEVYYMENGEIQQDLVQVIHSEDGHGFSPFNWEYSCEGCECEVLIESVEIIDNPDLLKAGGQG